MELSTCAPKQVIIRGRGLKERKAGQDFQVDLRLEGAVGAMVFEAGATGV